MIQAPIARPLIGYLAAVVGVILATYVRLALTPLLGTNHPFVTFLVVVLVMAWVCGSGPSLVALVFGALAANFFFLPPFASFWVRDAVTLTAVLLYLFVGGVAIAISAAERRARRRLEESHAQLDALLGSSPIGLALVDRDHRIVRINESLAALDGQPVREHLGRTVQEVFPDLWADLGSVFGRVIEDEGPVLGREIGVAPTERPGEARTVVANTYPVRLEDQGVVGIGLAVVDITERRAAEKAAREVDRRFRELADAMPQVAFITGADGQLLYVNSRWTEYTGLDLEDTRAQAGLFAAMHPEDLPIARRRWTRSLYTWSEFEHQCRLRRASDGAYRWFLSRAVPVRDGRRRVVQWFGTSTDIEDQKRTEQKLQENEATLRAFYDNSPVCMGLVEPTGDGDVLHLYDNPATCRFFGVGPGSTAGRLASEFKGADPDVVSTWVAKYAESEATGGPVRFEHEYRTYEGPRWLSVTVSSIGPGPSSRTRFCYVAEDVTERRRLSEQLEEERDLLDAFFASSPVGHGLVGPDLRFRRINRAAADSNGLPVEEHLGRTLAEVLPHLWPSLEPSFRRVLETGEAIRDLDVEGSTFEDPDIRQSWLANYYPVRLGGSVFGVGFTIVETTEAKLREARLRKAEEQLRERAKLLEMVLATTPTPIFIAHDRECRDVTGNPAAYRFLKSPEGALTSAGAPNGLERIRGFQEYGDHAPIGAGDLPLQRAAREGVEVYGAELLFRFADGEVKHAYGNAVPLRDDAGEVVGAIAAFADVTQPKLAEAVLREADRRKDEFLAMLAHELRNPLAPIRNALMILEHADEDRETRVWARGIIDRQSRHLTSLVDDLLDVSRITRGKITLTKGPLAVASLLNTAVESSRPLLEAARHHLEMRLPGAPLHVEGDPTRLAQVVLNLLNNAAKYTPEGGEVHLVADREGDWCRISVRDNGEGIAPEMLPHVFDLFTQANRSLDRAQGGLGVGLTLVKRLVEMHGGTVEAHSDGPNQGSEFVVRLPLLADFENGGPAADRRGEAAREAMATPGAS
jgi:PAS domain S-box-containing protein